MVRRLALLLAFAGTLGLAGALAAHDGHDHGKKIMGTVKAVHAEMNHVQITTKDGQTAEFYVDANTRYLKGGKSVALSELAPGTRVIVDTRTDGQRTLATTVRIGGAPKTAPKSSSAHQQ